MSLQSSGASAMKSQLLQELYYPVSPLMIFPKTMGKFEIYIKQAGRYVLYAKQNERFTERHRQRLHDYGVQEIYIRGSDKACFERYVESNLADILVDEAIPVDERSSVFYNASINIVKDVFELKLPTGLTERMFGRIAGFVEKSAEFLTREGSIKHIATLIDHDYKTYSHSVQVFVFSNAILQTFNLPEKDLVQASIGALMHDIGKSSIDTSILNKPGPFTPAEREIYETHPARGVALCASTSLSSLASNCILFHHEKLDGSGFPAGLQGNAIPLPVRAVTIADVYDLLTTNRPHREALTPFEALRVMRNEMSGAFDSDVFKKLVMVLSGAEII
ncbi:HD-GYP domain-containing protein [Desulfovibrio inopinatus]|uniref:HD-GYP domain-containing protein n=1 Tax=Desulfovibrio inopinatus TaxID=102109 RepID=UPI001FDFFD36|nr:HD domain-containing phosphohydrolase [Desulfovibrio inopinatus]